MRDESHMALTGSTVLSDASQDHSDPSIEAGTEQPSPLARSIQRPLVLEGKEIVPFTLQEEISVGDYIITVLDVKTAERLGTYISEETFHGKIATHLFYVVHLVIKNTAAKETYAPPDLFFLSDGAYEYSLDEEGTSFLFESSIFYPVLRTGLKRTVKIAYDVPEGSYTLHIHDGNLIYELSF